ncbi:S49 family peptidase [bacterium]|nr:S49 family peptidase [bacterium]
MWLLSAAVRQQIEQAQRSGVVPTMSQQVEFEARRTFEPGAASRLLAKAGGVAEITVSGVITKAPSFLAMMFGGGNITYPEIAAALAEADADPEVTRAEIRIDSPGGHFDGLFDAIAAMQAFSKPLKAVVHNQAASAAYALASQADEIVANNRAARVGSIGVVIDTIVYAEEISITSTEAPKKRPDLRTEEGQAVLREELDALHELFVDAIATGRNTSAKTINADFGQGATLLAEEALKRGMIDSIAEPALRVVKSTTNQTTALGGNTPETGIMDLKTLKAQHPDVYASAMQEGVAAERDRVTAHVTMGEAAGAMDIAVKAITDGDEYTAKHMALYNAAALRTRDQSNRQDDDAAASAANGASNAEESADAADLVYRAVAAQLGIQGE